MFIAKVQNHVLAADTILYFHNYSRNAQEPFIAEAATCMCVFEINLNEECFTSFSDLQRSL